MKLKYILITICLLAISGCTFVPANEGPRPRSAEENNSITDAWYPIQSKECALLVDSFGLIQAAIGSTDGQSLIDNLDEIKKDLETTGLIVSQELLELSQTTSESSIKEYALEAIPLFVKLGDLIISDTEDSSAQVDFINRMYELTGKVPDACKS